VRNVDAKGRGDRRRRTGPEEQGDDRHQRQREDSDDEAREAHDV
jgi:hypothetical protein